VTRNASQSHSCRYREDFSIPSATITGAISGLGYLVRLPPAALPFALATRRSIHRLLEYRCLTTPTDSLKSVRRLLVRFNVFRDILNVLSTGQKIPHSGGAVKRMMRREHSAKLSSVIPWITPLRLPLSGLAAIGRMPSDRHRGRSSWKSHRCALSVGG